MTAWMWKLVPWGIALLGVVLAVQMYGAHREARGEMKALVEAADRLEAEMVKDSVDAASRLQVQKDSIVSLNRTLARADIRQRKAKTEADSLVGALASSLDSTQRVQLTAITATFDREREAWSVKEMVYTARLRLKDDSLGAVVEENDKLRAINANLRLALKSAQPGHGASFIQRASPYVAGVLGVVYAIDKVRGAK